jgi:hypothetical protein
MTMTQPLATETAPSPFPLSLTTLVVFYRDSPPFPLPSSITELPPPTNPTNDTVNAKGIAYLPQRGLVVSLTANLAGNPCLKVIDPQTGSRSRWAPKDKNQKDLILHRGMENKLAVVPARPGSGFTPGDLFVATGNGGNGGGISNQIARVRADGSDFQQTWAEPSAALQSLDGKTIGGPRGGLAFDNPGGAFNGELIVLLRQQQLFRVDSSGTATLIADLSDLGLLPEGVAVTPTTFGPHSGEIAVGIEGNQDDSNGVGSNGAKSNGGKIYLVSANKTKTLLADIHSATEDLRVVPAMGGTLYLTEIDFHHESGNRILVATSSQLLPYRGQLLAINEMSGEIWAIAYVSLPEPHYTLTLIGRVFDWTSEGLTGPPSGEASELEQCCFAEVEPVLPNWTSFSELPGGFTTDQHVACCANDKTLYVIGTSNGHGGYTAGELYYSKLENGQWDTPWHPLGFAPTHNTTLAPAAAVQHGKLHVFAVDSATNKTYHSDRSIGTWEEVPSMSTTLAPAAALVNGWVVLCVVSSDTNALRINELRPTGQPGFTGPVDVPASDPNAPRIRELSLTSQTGPGPTAHFDDPDTADYAPAVAGFQGDLWLFHVHSSRVYVRARTAAGQWTNSTELPGFGRTDVGVGAAGLPSLVAGVPYSKQLYTFLKESSSNHLQINMASETGTWSGWSSIDTTHTTDRAIAACVQDATKPVVHQFAKRLADGKVLWRNTQ